MRRKVDNVVLPLSILLPMNTTKNDVLCYVNEEVKKLVDGTELLVSSSKGCRGRGSFMCKSHHFLGFLSVTIVENTSVEWNQRQM